jgi:hypothetical protein
MRKYILIIPLSLILFYCVMQCKKDAPKDAPINIVLYNQPLKTIQHYIQGKWRLVYGKGGICGTCKFPCDNCFIEFTSSNKVISNSFVITSDTTSIHWTRDIGTYTNNDSTYLMHFWDKQGVPWVYVIQEVYYDTLIYHDNSSDAMFYHCVKSK